MGNGAKSILTCAFAVAFALLSVAAVADPIVRENDPITINGVTEHWKLIWESPPSLVCVPVKDDSASFYTCPCMGYAYGENGVLDLVRNRPGKDDEVLHLTPLFKDSEWPTEGKAIVQRWPLQEGDLKKFDPMPDDVMEQIQGRGTVKAIHFGDYDHGGMAAEFLLQVDVAPCGKSLDALIGVSHSNPKLHLIGTAEHPDKPLFMFRHMWDELLKSNGDVTTIEWSCGDHGSEVQDEVQLRTDKDGIHATRQTYNCDKNRNRGSLKSTEIL